MKHEKVELRLHMPKQKVPLNESGYMTFEGRMFTTVIRSIAKQGDVLIVNADGQCDEFEEEGDAQA